MSDRPRLLELFSGEQMPWATRAGVSQAIPPAYTHWIGAQLLGVVIGRAVA